ncbi:MAG: peptidoglycan-binding domain-containing protein, partial [Ideonella sp.]
ARFAAGVAVGVVLFAAGLAIWRDRDERPMAVAAAVATPASRDEPVSLPAGVDTNADANVNANANANANADALGAMLAASAAPAAAASATTPAAFAPASKTADNTRVAAIGLNDLVRGLRAAPVDEQAAWRALGDQWGLKLGPGDACLAAAQLRLGCYKSRGGIALVRQLGRPGILTVQTRQAGEQRLLLVGIDARYVTLLVAGQRRKLSLIDLAAIWQGGFSNFWRVPEPLLQAAPADGSEPLAGWLSQRLAIVDGGQARPEIHQIDSALRERLLTFQRAQGLDADGLPGPMTLMALNRATGVVEPRLASDR